MSFTIVIQANKYGGSCIMELGVYLDFLESKVSKNITTYDCDFRQRIEAERTLLERLIRRKSEKWHNYGNNEIQAIKTIKEMARLFQDKGMAYFNQFDNFPNIFTEIKLEEITKDNRNLEKLGYLPTQKKLALILSRVHQYLGNKNQQEIFNRWGIE
jgi:hypothetical protein